MGDDTDPQRPGGTRRTRDTEDTADSATASSTASEITRLDDRTVREIAAGEVVERPASVVKELVENAFDADAERVAVAVEDGGLDGIRVRDDGHGIPPDQLPNAVAEHATSKLDGIDDLDAGVGSLGFRGEALYTVGAVSTLTVRSRPPDRDVGAEITVDHGETSDVEPAGCPVGTTVEVRELFAETPARRKFLKTPATEFDRVNGVVSAYALANPEVAVSFEHDDRELFGTPGNGDRRAAVLAVYGREVAESMVDVDARQSVPAGDVRVHGLVSEPETTRASREYVTTFVDGRWVSDADLRSAVVDAYGGQLAADRYPFAVVFLDVPPRTVDVNVHPRKTEVRFDDDAAVYETVREAVREGLLDAGLLRSSAPRGRSAPTETELDPEVVRGGDDGSTTDTEAVEAEGVDSVTQSESRGDEPVEDHERETTSAVGETSESTAGARSQTAGERSQTDEGESQTDEEGGQTDEGESQTDEERSQTDEESRSIADADADTVETESSTTTDAVLDAWGTSGGQSDESADREPADEEPREETTEASTGEFSTDTPDADETGDPATADSGSVAVPTQHTLAGGTTDDWREYDTLPSLRVLGQYDDTYLVCETAAGLVLLDQHAADERVNYERLREAAGLDGDEDSTEGQSTVQALAEPVRVPLTPRESALFDQFRDALAAAGFHARRVEDPPEDAAADEAEAKGDEATAADEAAVEVTAVPAVFDAALDPTLLRDTLVSFAEEVTSGSQPATAAAEDLLADLACYPSITGNTSLTEGSATELLAALDECENPYACPHGRPVVVEFGADEIANRFERDYPGHESRRE